MSRTRQSGALLRPGRPLPGQPLPGQPLPDEAGPAALHRDPEGRPLPDPRRPVVGFARSYPDGQLVARHSHEPAQLLYASSGLMRVETEVGFWVVPPQRAVWIPARMEHQVAMAGATEMRSLYLLRGLEGLPADCQVIAVSPLLRELIAAFIAGPATYAPGDPQARLVAVILDQLRAPVLASLHLPVPAAPRLRRLVAALLADPADNRSLDDWARVAGASARTLARLFEAETGLGFRAWRQQLRLHEALARLAAGEAVTAVAYAVGYDSPSAFIAMFRKTLGTSPQRYMGKDAEVAGEGAR